MFVSLIGANGAGKSTLLKCLMHLLKAQTGSVLIDQKDLASLEESEIAKLRASVLSDRVYPFNMTVKEIVTLGRYPHQSLMRKLSKNDKKIIAEASELLGINQLLERKFSELSDGQKQKVLIARAVVQEPKVLLLDEPATHLDAKSRIEILLNLREIAKIKKMIVIASMHEIEIAYRISDKIIVLEDGNIKANDFSEEIFKNGIVQEIYSIQKTIWHPVFGTLELKSENIQFPEIHVVGGFGTAISTYRLLSRLGFPFSTGILDKIDVDYCMASAINAKIFSNSSPYDLITINESIISEIGCVKLVIDTGFPINEKTTHNIKLVKELKKSKKELQVFSLRKLEESIAIFGQDVPTNTGNLGDLETFLRNNWN